MQRYNIEKFVKKLLKNFWFKLQDWLISLYLFKTCNVIIITSILLD